MFRKFKESLGENQPISWPLYFVFGYILLPIGCFFSSIFISILLGGLNANSSRWELMLCGIIGFLLGISVATINLFYKRNRAKQDYFVKALQGTNVIVNKYDAKFKFDYECPACGKIWENDNVPVDKRCSQDFLLLKEVDPIERDNFYDL